MKRRSFEAELVRYLADVFFAKDLGELAKRTGYTKHRVESWESGAIKPHIATIRWMLYAVIAPEFKVVKEFAPIAILAEKEIRPQLQAILGGHTKSAGVYSFYDSMCNVVYVGKASKSLFTEMNQQLRKPLGIRFPKAVSAAPTKRWHAVKYVSAYEVPHVDHLDYPKHVESLILRLSKPVGNKILGKLEKSSAPKVE